MAFPLSPNLQSIQSGAHKVQQHAEQKRYESPQASHECQVSMQKATPQA